MAFTPVSTQLVTVTVDSAPNGVPAGAPEVIDCILELGAYTQERATTSYECMSTNDSYVGLGAITRSPLEFKMLYNEVATDGQSILQENFATNTQIEATIEFNNMPLAGTNGTTLTGIFGISKFDMTFEKDGNVGADFSLEFIGEPAITPAA